MNDERIPRPTSIPGVEPTVVSIVLVSVEAIPITHLNPQVFTRSRSKREIADIKPVQHVEVKKPKHEVEQVQFVNLVLQQMVTARFQSRKAKSRGKKKTNFIK